MKPDRTFDPDAAYGSRQWVARRLGKSLDWLSRNMERLEGEGFPARDPITLLWLKEDVDAWIKKRSRVSESSVTISVSPISGVNYEHL